MIVEQADLLTDLDPDLLILVNRHITVCSLYGSWGDGDWLA